MREARWFARTRNGLRCELCPRGCTFAEGSTALGLCRVRGVRDGKPYLPGYGECVSLSIDPIEKKPLYHFMPGMRILSTGPAGCNLTCDFCQNWTISQSPEVPTRYVAPDDLAELAMSRGSSGVAFTYTEPTIWYEYIMDTAPLVLEKGGAVVMVSNGEIRPEPLAELIRVTNAWNVDLKSWSEDFYMKHCTGSRKAVLETLETLAASECHLEVTFLVIPGENDDPQQWLEMARWLKDHCGRETVFHISRYFPRYMLNKEPTPLETLERAAEVFSQHLDHVYLGNVATDLSDTVCSSCGETCVSRNGFRVDTEGMREDGSCGNCGASLNIVTRVDTFDADES